MLEWCRADCGVHGRPHEITSISLNKGSIHLFWSFYPIFSVILDVLSFKNNVVSNFLVVYVKAESEFQFPYHSTSFSLFNNLARPEGLSCVVAVSLPVDLYEWQNRFKKKKKKRKVLTWSRCPSDAWAIHLFTSSPLSSIHVCYWPSRHGYSALSVTKPRLWLVLPGGEW